MKLYMVELRGMTYSSTTKPCNGIAYVVAENTDEAYTKVKKYLDERDLGFSKERGLKAITLIADTGDYHNCDYRLYL